MSRRSVDIFGKRFVPPHSLRKSPGRNWFHKCIAKNMNNRKFGSREEARASLAATADSCSNQKNVYKGRTKGKYLGKQVFEQY